MKRQKFTAAPLQWPSLLFEDRFLLKSVDNSKFERASRIRAKSIGYDAEIILDINTSIYPVHPKESITIAISTEVAPLKSEPKTAYDLIDTNEKTLMDFYDYCMYGKVFRVEDKTPDVRTIYASFGGLLLSLTAEKEIVTELELDLRIYLLIRKDKEY